MQEIVHGECLAWLESYQGQPFDFVFADLPYGTTQNPWDEVIDLPRMWAALRRVCKPNAAMCFTAQQPFTTTLIASNMREFRYDWVWKKNRATGFMNAKKMPLKQHESIVVFYRRQPTYNPQMGVGAPYHVSDHKGAGGLSVNYGRSSGRVRVVSGVTQRYPTSIVDIGVVLRGADHPTQKPVPLLEYLIRTYSNPGDLVLDPTAGALTTAVAAHRTGRSSVCIELNAEYIELGRARLADEGMAQPEARARPSARASGRPRAARSRTAPAPAPAPTPAPTEATPPIPTQILLAL